MRKFLAFIAITTFCLIYINCNTCSNPLLKSNKNPDGATGLTNPAVVTGLKFCKYLEGKEACCSADEINKIKDSIKKKIKSINKN